jgi:hypothetical protein
MPRAGAFMVDLEKTYQLLPEPELSSVPFSTYRIEISDDG